MTWAFKPFPRLDGRTQAAHATTRALKYMPEKCLSEVAFSRKILGLLDASSRQDLETML